MSGTLYSEHHDILLKKQGQYRKPRTAGDPTHVQFLRACFFSKLESSFLEQYYEVTYLKQFVYSSLQNVQKSL